MQNRSVLLRTVIYFSKDLKRKWSSTFQRRFYNRSCPTRPHRIAAFWLRIALDIRIKHSIRLKPTTPSASPASSFPVLPPPFFPVFVARLPTSHDAELRPLFLVSQRARRHFTGVL